MLLSDSVATLAYTEVSLAGWKINKLINNGNFCTDYHNKSRPLSSSSKWLLNWPRDHNITWPTDMHIQCRPAVVELSLKTGQVSQLITDLLVPVH